MNNRYRPESLRHESNPHAFKIRYTQAWVKQNGYCPICCAPCGSGRRFWGNHSWKQHRRTQYRTVMD